MLAAMSVAPGDKDGLPFQGPSLWPRVIPSASAAVLAEASLALPPGPNSAGAVLANVLLLLVKAVAFRLPWSRLPEWAPAVVPCCTSARCWPCCWSRARPAASAS